VLAVKVPFHVTARLHRTVGAAVAHYSLESSSLKDSPAVLDTWTETTGTLESNGHILATSFPTTLSLIRHTSVPKTTRQVAKTEVEFTGSTTAFHVHWSDQDFQTEWP
jgi:hypothetical protein